MATVKISTLPGAAALTGTEEVPAVQSAATVKTTAQAIADIAITAVVAGAPASLNTLDELAAAINDDPAFSATVSTALGLKADIASPTFTGSPAAPTQTAGDNTTKLATTAFVKTAVEAAITGLSWKQAVRVATTGPGTIATDFENGDTIDGVVLATGDRILIKNQATASENGIYIVSATGAPTRATDADAGSELVNASVYVSEGTTLADTQWTCSTNAPITVDVTNITFAQLTSGGGATVASDAIWDAKGDIAVATGADAASKLAVGTDGQVLTADSTQSTGVKWATPASAYLEDRRFSLVSTVTPRSLCGVQVLNEPFTSDTGQFTKYTEGTPGSFSVAGTATVTNSTGSARNDIIVTGSDISLPVWGVQIDIVSRSGTPSGYDNIGVGIAKDSNNFVFASYDRIAGNLRVQVKISGTNTFNSDTPATLSAGEKLGFSMICNSICVYKYSSGSWSYICGYSIPTGTINFKTASLTGWKTGFTVATPNNSTWEFDNLISGPYGAFGMRDPSFVTEEDGSTYDDGTNFYFLSTCADPLGESHQGVFSLNKSTYAVSMVGNMMIDRGSSKQNDIAGHLIRYSSSSYRLSITTWGNGFGGVLDLYSGTTTQNLLSGSYLVSGLTKLNIPSQGSGYACYDPHLVKVGSTWKLAHAISTNTSFSGSPFFPVLSTSTDLSTWTTSVQDNGTRPFEGTKYFKDGSDYYITAGGPYEIRVYDGDLNFRGYLRASSFGGNLVTQPHGAIAKTSTKYIVLSFTGDKPTTTSASFSWGNLLIHEASI